MLPPKLEAERRAMLDAALARVPFDGWSEGCLEDAARQAGFAASMVRRAFPRGVVDALAFFGTDSDRRMLAALATVDLGAMAVRERIATALRLRLEMWSPHREAVRQAVAVMAAPGHWLETVPGLWGTVDAIWRAAGDTATDINHYTKRGLLAGVYGTTLLYWLDDRSEGFGDTWGFLDRRLGDVMRIQAWRGRADAIWARVEPLVGGALRRAGNAAYRGRDR